MNKCNIFPAYGALSKTNQLMTNSVWAWENIVLPIQKQNVHLTQLLITATSREQYSSSENNIKFITNDRESNNSIVGELIIQQGWKICSNRPDMPFRKADNSPPDWPSDTIVISEQYPIIYSGWNELQPTETTQVAQPFSLEGFTLLNDVAVFAVNNGLCDFLRFAIDCLKSAFGTDKNYIISKDIDPEISEEWINIDVKVEGNVNDILNKYDHVTELWVLHVPWPQRSMVRFSINPS